MSGVVSAADVYAHGRLNILSFRQLRPLADASDDPREVRRRVALLMGKRVRVQCSRNYTMDFRTQDQIILVQEDFEAWRRLPCMEGRLHVIGVLGPDNVMDWDKPVLGMSRTGKLFTFHLASKSHVIYLCDSFRHLYENGVDEDYLHAVDVVERMNPMSRVNGMDGETCDMDTNSNVNVNANADMGMDMDSSAGHTENDDDLADLLRNRCRITPVRLGSLSPTGTVRGRVTDKLLQAAKGEMLLLRNKDLCNY